MPADPTVPAPGPDTPTWTVDDDGRLTSSRHIIKTAYNTPTDKAVLLRPDDFAALVADVRAARAHEHCGPATDTLQRARELAARAVDPKVPSIERGKAGGSLILLLTHPLVDGGTDG